MLLYLTGKDKVNLLDFAENETGLIPKKMTGKFSLLQFIIRDMRNYAHLKYFVIDRTAVTEDDNSFVEAISSFHTMFDARIIVICEGYSELDSFIQQLIMKGVTDIVTAVEIEDIQREILECLSPKGMLRRYKMKQEKPKNQDVPINDTSAVKKYTFECENIQIAVAGSQRRVGVTTTAVNLACWIQAHGGTACYIESHRHKHMTHILTLYNNHQEDHHYTIGDVDFYLTDEIDKTYNFIITDCGELEEPLQDSFTESDLRLICGSAMPYEIVFLKNAMERCGGMAVQALGMYVPLDLRGLLQDTIGNGILFADASHDLFDDKANSKLNKALIGGYITDTKNVIEAVQE